MKTSTPSPTSSLLRMKELNIIVQRDKLIRRGHEEMTNEGIQKTTNEIITKQNAVLKNLKELKKLTKSNITTFVNIFSIYYTT